MSLVVKSSGMKVIIGAATLTLSLLPEVASRIIMVVQSSSQDTSKSIK